MVDEGDLSPSINGDSGITETRTEGVKSATASRPVRGGGVVDPDVRGFETYLRADMRPDHSVKCYLA
ncbi:MAG TPA: hypothetical protein VI893_00800, partial [Thermoplasmata archaeon]|nr:hypothetical protein [Thermoplasmata archaeon]